MTRARIESRALIQNSRREYLIIRTVVGDDQPWEFPGGRVQQNESPEAAMRRLCRALIGADVELQQGQPPFVYNFGTHSITFRYFIVCLAREEIASPTAAELRSVQLGQLRDYVFDAPTQQVVDWLLSAADNR